MITKPEYLDNAATTKVDERVFDAIKPFFMDIYGNASSNHDFGKQAKKAVDIAKGHVANIINCNSKEVVFTSGATESINFAIKGFLEANPEKGNHIITVKTEHKAVLSTCEYLENKGIDVTYLNVNENGLISLKDLEASIKNNTSLIIVMYVNNEIGIIQPIDEIGTIAKKHNITFLCDATQAIGKVRVDVDKSKIDLLALSAHKLNGPKGIGALFVRDRIKLTPLLHGGGQENGLRAGTYNTPLIVGLGKACEIAIQEFDATIEKLKTKIIEVETYYETNNIGIVNFKNIMTAPHITSISLCSQDAEDYLLMNHKNFIASTGSACNSALVEISHVLKAIGKKDGRTMRISICQ